MSITPGNTNLLTTKAHFEILDGLRGIAAIAVVIFHFMEMAILDYADNFIGHGFLAVDFFFCLSGFVIAYAYDGRMAKIKLKDFVYKRLIRLHPLVILGSVLGLLTFIFNPFKSIIDAYSLHQVILLFLASILLIPYPLMSERAFNNFNLNAPSWSLFWEYIANLVYALLLYRLPRSILAAIALAGAILLCYMAHTKPDISGGWGGANFWDGGIRVLFSFTAGMLAFKYKLIVRNNLNFGVLGLMLLITFVVPYHRYWNAVIEPVIVIIYYPLLISLGAGSRWNQQHSRLAKFSGEISYPLYMTHYAAIWMFTDYYAANKPNANVLALIITLGVISLVALAYFWLKVFDEPIRKFLTQKLKDKESNN